MTGKLKVLTFFICKALKSCLNLFQAWFRLINDLFYDSHFVMNSKWVITQASRKLDLFRLYLLFQYEKLMEFLDPRIVRIVSADSQIWWTSPFLLHIRSQYRIRWSFSGFQYIWWLIVWIVFWFMRIEFTVAALMFHKPLVLIANWLIFLRFSLYSSRDFVSKSLWKF